MKTFLHYNKPKLGFQQLTILGLVLFMLYHLKRVATFRISEQPGSLLLLNPLTPGAFCRKRIFRTFWRFFRLDIGQISFDLVKKALAMWQLAFLSTSIAFYDIFVPRACVEIAILRISRKWPTSLGLIWFYLFSPFLLFFQQWFTF